MNESWLSNAKCRIQPSTQSSVSTMTQPPRRSHGDTTLAIARSSQRRSSAAYTSLRNLKRRSTVASRFSGRITWASFSNGSRRRGLHAEKLPLHLALIPHDEMGRAEERPRPSIDRERQKPIAPVGRIPVGEIFDVFDGPQAGRFPPA